MPEEMQRSRSVPRYEVSDDFSRLDRDAIWRFLSTEAYWHRWRTREDVQHQIDSAWRVVAVYTPSQQVGFARAMSDGVANAYLADLYVETPHRGRGLGTRMLQLMIEEGPGAHFRWMLHTRDAHGLYKRFGFAEPSVTYMERRRQRPDSKPNREALDSHVDPPPGPVTAVSADTHFSAQRVRYRVAAPDEVDTAVAVWHLAHPGQSESAHPRHMREWARDPGCTVYVAELRGEVVAAVLALPGRAADGAGPVIPGLVHLTGVAVVPALQSKGIGTALLKQALAASRRKGLLRATLWTDVDNTAARRFFTRHGFVPTGRTRVSESASSLVHLEADLTLIGIPGGD